MTTFGRKATSQAEDKLDEGQWPLHSFDKCWRDPPKPWKQGRGQPALVWSPSQERILFRLISMGLVTMGNIASAMYEAASDEKPEFAPSKGACGSKWNRMSEMLPSEVRIQDRVKRETQRKTLGEAHKRWRSTISGSNIPVRNDALHPALESAPMPSIALSSLPPLTFDDGPSPNEASVSTPQPLRLGTVPDDFAELVMDSWDTTKNGLPQCTSAQGTAPLASIGSREPVKQAPPTVVQTDQSRISSGAARSIAGPGLRSNAPANVGKKYPSKAAQPKQTRKTIAEVEDAEGLERGTIDYVKYQLTITRLSTISTTSDQGPASRSAPSFSKQRLPVTCSCTGESGSWSCALEPNIFQILRRAGATDNQIADQLEELLRDKSATKTKDIVNARSCMGETALQVVLELGHVPACRFLLRAGADVLDRTSDGQTLSSYGRTAIRNAISNAHIWAIGTCRNEIYSGPRPRKKKQPLEPSALLERLPKRPCPTSSTGQQGEEGSLDHRPTAGVNAQPTPFHSPLQENLETRDYSSSAVTTIGSMTDVGNSYAHWSMNTMANPRPRPLATSMLDRSQDPPTGQRQATLSVVPSLVKQYNGMASRDRPFSASSISNSIHKTQPYLTNDAGSTSGYASPSDLRPIAEDSARGRLTESQSAHMSLATFGSMHPPGQWVYLSDGCLAFIPDRIFIVDGVRTQVPEPQIRHIPLKRKNPNRDVPFMGGVGGYGSVMYPLARRGSEQTLAPTGPSASDDAVKADASLQSYYFEPQPPNFVKNRNPAHPESQIAGFGVMNNDQYPAINSLANMKMESAMDTNYYPQTPFGMRWNQFSNTLEDGSNFM